MPSDPRHMAPSTPKVPIPRGQSSGSNPSLSGPRRGTTNDRDSGELMTPCGEPSNHGRPSTPGDPRSHGQPCTPKDPSPHGHPLVPGDDPCRAQAPSASEQPSDLTVEHPGSQSPAARRRRGPSARGSKLPGRNRVKPAAVGSFSVVSTCSVVFNSPGPAAAAALPRRLRRRSTPSVHVHDQLRQHTALLTSRDPLMTSHSPAPATAGRHSQLASRTTPTPIRPQAASTPRDCHPYQHRHQIPHNHTQTPHHQNHHNLKSPPTTTPPLHSLPAANAPALPARPLGGATAVTGSRSSVILPLDCCMLRLSSSTTSQLDLTSKNLLMRGAGAGGHDLDDLQTSMKVIGLGNSAS